MRRVVLPLILALLFLPACRLGAEQQLAGDEVGRYQVQATLTSNECAEGHPAPAELSFVVDLRHLPGSTSGYWKLPDGPLVDGQLEREADFRFEQATTVVAVPTDTVNGVAGCVVERREVVGGTLVADDTTSLDGGFGDGGVSGDGGSEDAGAQDAGALDGGSGAAAESSFSGTTRVTIRAMPGGDCTPLLAVYGGTFPTLPCSLEYSLRGTRVAAE